MKTRFSTVDLLSVVAEIRSLHVGLRVYNVYDVDNRTYLLRLTGTDGVKAVILVESGNRIHSTDYDWPKNPTPSGFAMKLRKHLRNRRLESIALLGMDRIVDMCFGSGEAAYHVIVELYDRGNIILTDHELTIINILRPRTDDSHDVRFAVRERYPIESAKPRPPMLDRDALKEILRNAKPTDAIKRVLNPHLVYGPSVIEHALLLSGLNPNTKVSSCFSEESTVEKLEAALAEAENILNLTLRESMKGYIIQKREKRPAMEEDAAVETANAFLLTYDEFHPFLYKQHEQNEKVDVLEFPSFSQAVDEFYSKLESQKLDSKALQQEKSALKKLENVKADHTKRLDALRQAQETDKMKGDLIEINLDLVEKALSAVRALIANQLDWDDIKRLVGEAAASGDPVASRIKGLKLETDSFTLLLSDPYEGDFHPKSATRVDIDLELSAHANARKYFDHRRQASEKEGKTIDSSTKALKNAEKKTKQVLREVQTAVAINKTRHTHWFEKFLWFISSENYVVIAGRDAQQNELLVKKYLRPGDVYVHADLHGASTVVVKNRPGAEIPLAPDQSPIPPKTLSEAGTMAVCHSQAWDAKIVTSAWWVHHHQVSKTAPTGEYLTTGSFMIRGKKNYLPPCYLVMGFGFMFRLDDDSVKHHEGERRVKTAEEEGREDANELNEYEEEEVEAEANDSAEDEGENAGEAEGEEEDDIDEVKKAEEREIKMRASSSADEDPREDAAEDKSKEMKIEKDSVGFPDTEIRMQVDASNRVKLQAFKGLQSLSMSESPGHLTTEDSYVTEEPDGTKIVTLGDHVAPLVLGPRASRDDAGAKPKLSAKQRRELKKKQKKASEAAENEESLDPIERPIDKTLDDKNNESEEEQRPPSSQPEPMKRGKRAKMKKIKEKYKDQDEEDKERAIALLRAGGDDEGKKLKGKKAKDMREKEKVIKLAALEQRRKEQRERFTNREPVKIGEGQVIGATVAGDMESRVVEAWGEIKGEDLDSEDLGLGLGNDDLALINALTGSPSTEDTLLYVVPVCAPYSVMNNYKYKVKLTPGMNKKGKAAKTALNLFFHDRTCTSIEKDLMKAVKDVDLSRNIPGKVKLSAPHLHASKAAGKSAAKANRMRIESS